MKNIKRNTIITMKPVDVVDHKRSLWMVTTMNTKLVDAVMTMVTKSVDAGMTMNMGVVIKRVIRMFNQMRSKSIYLRKSWLCKLCGEDGEKIKELPEVEDAVITFATKQLKLHRIIKRIFFRYYRKFVHR
ncbi:MAG: hypothetical protein ACLTCI_07740 [[Clostridium] nexile]